MKKEDILAMMKKYVQDYIPSNAGEDIKQKRVIDVLESSFDVVDFTTYLEENLELDANYLSIKTWAPKFANISFMEMASELEQVISHPSQSN